MQWLNRKPPRRDAVEIQEKRFGYFPKTFRRRGRCYDVDAVERCWTSRATPQLCFRVRCRKEIFELYQNIRDNTWRLVPLQS
jgi:hypothetical protein